MHFARVIEEEEAFTAFAILRSCHYITYITSWLMTTTLSSVGQRSRALPPTQQQERSVIKSGIAKQNAQQMLYYCEKSCVVVKLASFSGLV